jgi:hypothetical protein
MGELATLGRGSGQTIQPAWRQWVSRLLAVVACLYLVSAAVVLIRDGFDVRLGALRLSSHSAPRDLLFAVAAGVIGRVLRRQERALLTGTGRLAPWIAGGASVAIFWVGLVAGTHCACGSDVYGYVSQAALWADGTLHVPEPLMSIVPWRSAAQSLAPLGYQPATYPGAIVPVYSPGLPMLMAVALKVWRSPSAVFVVVPLLGALAVWCTFLLGRRLHGPILGLWAALLLASSTTFVFHVIVPMSDVPVTAWWLVTVVMLQRRTHAAALLGGLASSWAVLTRPNLVLLTPVCLLLVWPDAFERRTAPFLPYRRLALFCLGALPGPLAVGWIQKSGYGDLHGLFSVANIGPNVKLYPQWLWETHGPFLFLGLLSPFVHLLRRRSMPQATRAEHETAAANTGRFVSFALAFTGVLFAEYVCYRVFDGWTFTRFLLPAIPLLLILGVWTISESVGLIGSPAAHAYVMILFAFLAYTFMQHAASHNVLFANRADRGSIEAGRFIASTTSPEVMVVTMQHSGSMRYYGHRETVRYDWLDPDELDRAIVAMHQMSRGPLVVLDDWEEPHFREQFRGQKWGTLDWPPRAEFETQPRVRVYDPFDRDRYLAHQPVPTMRFESK